MTDKRVRVNGTRPRSSHIAKSLYGGNLYGVVMILMGNLYAGG